MHKLEQRFMMCHHHDHWRLKLVDGEEVPDWRSGPSMFECSDQLGEEGW
jgi:hypothetical protein